MKQRRAVVFCVRGVPRCLTRASADGRACCVCIATIVNSAAVARRVQIFLRYPVGISLDADPEMGHGRIVWSLHCRFFFRILFVVFHSGRTGLRFEVPGVFFECRQPYHCSASCSVLWTPQSKQTRLLSFPLRKVYHRTLQSGG